MSVSDGQPQPPPRRPLSPSRSESLAPMLRVGLSGFKLMNLKLACLALPEGLALLATPGWDSDGRHWQGRGGGGDNSDVQLESRL